MILLQTCSMFATVQHGKLSILSLNRLCFSINQSVNLLQYLVMIRAFSTHSVLQRTWWCPTSAWVLPLGSSSLSSLTFYAAFSSTELSGSLIFVFVFEKPSPRVISWTSEMTIAILLFGISTRWSKFGGIIHLKGTVSQDGFGFWWHMVCFRLR